MMREWWVSGVSTAQRRAAFILEIEALLGFSGVKQDDTQFAAARGTVLHDYGIVHAFCDGGILL